jgi:hypothetical protein
MMKIALNETMKNSETSKSRSFAFAEGATHRPSFMPIQKVPVSIKATGTSTFLYFYSLPLIPQQPQPIQHDQHRTALVPNDTKRESEICAEGAHHEQDDDC